MYKIIVLGAGLVGGPIAIDLSKESDFEISIADINEDSLARVTCNQRIKSVQKDLSNPSDVKNLVSDYDYVINAVPGFMGFQTLKAIIEAGKSAVDIAFFPEDFFLLNDLAKEKGVTIISDMGVAPGMSNVLIGYANAMLDRTEKAIIYVGGLPKIRELPFEYKAVFSPADVIEEYTRPARIVENGKIVIREALSEPELLFFPKIGTLEAFNSDGLRSLIKTIDAPFMVEKTLRYPGHIDKMKFLREIGFFQKEEIKINGCSISPLALTSKLLFPKWKLEEGEDDITIMKVIVEGEAEGKKTSYSWDLYDRYDHDTHTHSMARTTGYTASSALRMIIKGLYCKPGVSAPEFIGKNKECVKFLLNSLEERGIIYHEIKKTEL